jgi:NAD(P)-dependent dehydrogenase (short-subunit alcohol dehydrogenase family)
MLLQGKVAVITGGASGIGAACVRSMALEGAAVVIADRDEQLAATLAEQLETEGLRVAAFPVDVTDEEQTRAMVRFAVDRFGTLDCAVNAAGISHLSGPISKVSAQVWEMVLGINLMGVVHAMKYQLAVMVGKGSGTIVNISSVAGLRAAAMMAPYATSKHGVIGLTRSAAQESARKGVRVNAICPGLIDTPMLHQQVKAGLDVQRVVTCPMGRMGKAEEIADVAIWLSCSRSSFVTGQAIVVDGGQMLG